MLQCTATPVHRGPVCGTTSRGYLSRTKTTRRTTPSASSASSGSCRDVDIDCTASRPAQVLASLALTALVSLSAVPASQAVSGGGGASFTSLAGKDFSGQDLRGKNFNKADMRGINLSGANLEGNQMFGANLPDANLTGANLRYADLETVNFEGTDLTNAILEGAMLTNTQFKKMASIEGADFTDALIRRDVQKALCALPSAKGVNPVTGVSTRESLMCD